MKCRICKVELTQVNGILVQGNIFALTGDDKYPVGLMGQGDGTAVGKLRSETQLKDVEMEGYCFKCFLKAVVF